ncbi:GIY-YIG nuclease family protein [Patescibacteria group bacterium]
MYFVYLIQCKDGTLYTGIAKNIGERLKAHRTGKGAKYTRAHPPEKVVYFERKRNKSYALKREAEIKKLSRKEKLELVSV